MTRNNNYEERSFKEGLLKFNETGAWFKMEDFELSLNPNNISFIGEFRSSIERYFDDKSKKVEPLTNQLNIEKV